MFLDQSVVHIRANDMKEGNEFFIPDVTPEFIMDVLGLESLPRFLITESTGLAVKINPSNLVANEFYVVKGSGPAVPRKIKLHRNEGQNK